jgi:electron transport complex protein RnfC
MLNVTTVSTVGKFLRTGMPLVTKRLTVSGDAIANPQNVEVVIGAPIASVLDFCGLKEEPQKVIVGGPMMGASQMDVNYPITRQNNGLLAFGAASSQPVASSACIRCGRCVNACPMGLSPVDIRQAYFAFDADRLDQLMADLCIGCGSCSYVCPARRPLTQSVTMAKSFLKTKKKRGKS